MYLLCRQLTSCTSVAGAAALQPRVLVASAVFVKAYASIAGLARDLGQLQRSLNEKPYEHSLQALKPGQLQVLLKHPVTDHQMFPVDPRFVDVSDACHAALTQLLYSLPSRLNDVLELMEKSGKKEAKSRLDFMKKNSSLPPALPLFKPAEIKDHRLASSQLKPPGRLRINPARGEVDALDPNLEYKVAFEVCTCFFVPRMMLNRVCLNVPRDPLALQGVPADQDAWVVLPEDTAAVSFGVVAGQREREQPYTDLLQRYLSKP